MAESQDPSMLLYVPSTFSLANLIVRPDRDPQCPICGDMLDTGESVFTHVSNCDPGATQGCYNSFHPECLGSWLSTSTTTVCPWCNGQIREVMTDSGSEPGEEEFLDIPFPVQPSAIAIPGMVTIGHYIPSTVHFMDNATNIFGALEWDDEYLLDQNSPREKFVYDQINELLTASQENLLVRDDAIFLQSEQLDLDQDSLSTIAFWRRVVGCDRYIRVELPSAPNDILFLPDVGEVRFLSSLTELRSHIGHAEANFLMNHGTGHFHGPHSRTVARRFLEGIRLVHPSVWETYMDFCRANNFRHNRYWALFNHQAYGEDRMNYLVQWPESDIEANGTTPRPYPRISQAERAPTPENIDRDIQRNTLQNVSDTNMRDNEVILSTLWDAGEFSDPMGFWIQNPDGTIIPRDNYGQ